MQRRFIRLNMMRMMNQLTYKMFEEENIDKRIYLVYTIIKGISVGYTA